MALDHYNFLDTQVGDVVLNAAALTALFAASGQNVAFASVTTTGLNTESVTTALTASTTHTIAGATALPSFFNVIGTCASSGDAVKLAALSPGQAQIVFNSGAAPAGVYPAASGVAIDGGTAGAAVTLTNAKRAIYICVAANTIISAQLGVASA